MTSLLAADPCRQFRPIAISLYFDAGERVLNSLVRLLALLVEALRYRGDSFT